MNQLNDILKAKREERKWNKSQMARQLDVSSQLYGQYERGDKSPGADFFIKWKEVFGQDLTSKIETKVSRETNHTPVRPQEAQQAPDYRERYIQLLEEKINLNEARVLLMLQRNHALLNAVVETLPKLVAKLEKVKLLEAHEEMNKRIEHHLDVLKKENI